MMKWLLATSQLPLTTVWQFAVVSVLCGLTVNHLYYNIHDYLIDNTITTLNIEFTGDRFPFLPNFTLYLNFDPITDCNRSVFGQLLQDGDRSEHVQRCGLLLAAARTSRLDVEYVDFELRNVSWNDSVLDEIAARPSFAVEVDKIYNELVTSARINAELTDQSLSAFGTNYFYGMFHVERDFLRTVDQPRLVYCIGGDGETNLNISYYNLFDGEADNSLWLAGSRTFPSSVLLTYSSSSIVDIDGRFECDSGSSSDEQAVWRCEVFQVAQRCNCTPFYYRRQFSADQGPFCVESIYRECLTPETSREIKNACKASRPCVKVTYANTVRFRDYLMFCDHRSTIEIAVQCYFSTYLNVYTQQITSWTQLLSQIGGSIGLYLGFSFLTIFKLLDWMIVARRRNWRSVTSVGVAVVDTIGATCRVPVWPSSSSTSTSMAPSSSEIQRDSRSLDASFISVYV